MKFEIRDDQIENLRTVAKALDGVHDGCALVIRSTCNHVESHPIVEDGWL
jgi:hypothetical protein